MKVLIINQAFWPDVVATAQHMADWAEELSARGHEVTVIASRSIYGQNKSRLPRRENYRGTRVIRVGGNLFAKGRILTRLIDFGQFQFLAMLRALVLPRQDVVVCLTTPPFVGLVGRILRMLRGSRYVQYEMDLYPDVPVALGVMRPASRATRAFERLHRGLLRTADRVVVLGRCMARVLAEKGASREKMVLVTPWADPREIVPVPRGANAFRREQGVQDKFLVVYSGNLGLGHDIATICQAMELLYQERDESIAFAFIGGGKRMAEVRAFVERRGLPMPLLLDYQPRTRLSETLSAADVHLITQAPGTTGLIVPSKLYGILAAGRPAIYIGPPDTEVALTLRENGLGTLIAPGDAAGMVAALRNLQGRIAEQGAFEARARAYLAEHHSRQVCCAALTEMIETLVGKPGRPAEVTPQSVSVP